MFSAMRYESGCLYLIDQKRLPLVEVWYEGRTLESVAAAIESMVVRGAPAIGCAAAWGVAVGAWQVKQSRPKWCWTDYRVMFEEGVELLARTRPTAVNLFYALTEMRKIAASFASETTMSKVYADLHDRALGLEQEDIGTCKAIGSHGADLFDHPVSVLTHCNTGSLATAGYGTALGVIRSLNERGYLKSVFVDETRPYLQGSRLTAFELQQDRIPFQLIADNMAASAMQRGWVDVVMVGADRIAANGDTANKIGTYGLAVLCKHHNIPFLVAAPRSTIDLNIKTGAQIPVEERPAKELVEIQGIGIAPLETKVWNPSFDVTPAELISWIVTEQGALKPSNLR
ncbi:MAG: S-methyl-5-thioribose-1-phosphate isomerase [Proteobacteria bacterium]|nr:S-methyl-5-thioribose-1-phosphate isomerase [Pseudomonadota bacterium]